MKIDFHVHTNCSIDAVHSPRVMAKAAKIRGLDGIAITDHNRLFPWAEAVRLSKEFGLVVIPGMEGGNIAIQKHWIALGITSHIADFRLTMKKIFSIIHDDGGLSIAPHPATRRGFKNYARLGFDAVEILNGCNHEANSRIRNASNIPEVGGSDAHAAHLLGYTWTDVDASESIEDVLDSVHYGRCRPGGSCILRFPYFWFYPLYLHHRIILQPAEICREAFRAAQEIYSIRKYENARTAAECPNLRGDYSVSLSANRRPLDWH